uniref:Reverse transcriptase domain, reverse transcriptase zinc-binding domain protein n=1 Tax=Tanacetum cinerariifolium TaxID=118510 RepID=A0A699GK06_TANCI|nr:hypothetical protein [Tanacetum cinerariifolium]
MVRLGKRRQGGDQGACKVFGCLLGNVIEVLEVLEVKNLKRSSRHNKSSSGLGNSCKRATRKDSEGISERTRVSTSIFEQILQVVSDYLIHLFLIGDSWMFWRQSYDGVGLSICSRLIADAEIKERAGVEKGAGPSFASIITHLMPIAKRKSSKSCIGKLVVAAAAYFVWHERNSRLFNKVKRSVTEVVDCILSTVRLKLLSYRFKKSRDAIQFARLWEIPMLIADAKIEERARVENESVLLSYVSDRWNKNQILPDLWWFVKILCVRKFCFTRREVSTTNDVEFVPESGCRSVHWIKSRGLSIHAGIRMHIQQNSKASLF